MDIGKKVSKVPKNFSVHKTLKRIFDLRFQSVEKGETIDWSTAESLAFGTLLTEGFSDPEENYFKIPKSGIPVIREIRSAAVILVVEYLIRHAWGYQNPEGAWPQHSRRHGFGQLFEEGCYQQNLAPGSAPGSKATPRPSAAGLVCPPTN